MTKPKFTGVYPILPTPFRDDETIDLDSYARIVRFRPILSLQYGNCI